MFTYLAKSKIGYKIGQSKKPEQRIKGLKTANPEITLICYGTGISEKELHKKYSLKKINLEWYKLNKQDVQDVIRVLNNEYNGVDNSKNYERKLNYVIPFGKYKDHKLSQMTNREEISYIKWFLKNIPNKKNSKIHKMFNFWIKQVG